MRISCSPSFTEWVLVAGARRSQDLTLTAASTVTWSSLSTSVATVSTTGVVTGLAAGTV
nr:Ig-like domain-containing protein [Armatimonas sp.]